jgi:hypothetical protein
MINHEYYTFTGFYSFAGFMRKQKPFAVSGRGAEFAES